jgi:hypothetical protein
VPRADLLSIPPQEISFCVTPPSRISQRYQLPLYRPEQSHDPAAIRLGTHLCKPGEPDTPFQACH